MTGVRWGRGGVVKYGGPPVSKEKKVIGVRSKGNINSTPALRNNLRKWSPLLGSTENALSKEPDLRTVKEVEQKLRAMGKDLRKLTNRLQQFQMSHSERL